MTITESKTEHQCCLLNWTRENKKEDDEWWWWLGFDFGDCFSVFVLINGVGFMCWLLLIFYFLVEVFFDWLKNVKRIAKVFVHWAFFQGLMFSLRFAVESTLELDVTMMTKLPPSSTPQNQAIKYDPLTQIGWFTVPKIKKNK